MGKDAVERGSPGEDVSSVRLGRVARCRDGDGCSASWEAALGAQTAEGRQPHKSGCLPPPIPEIRRADRLLVRNVLTSPRSPHRGRTGEWRGSWGVDAKGVVTVRFQILVSRQETRASVLGLRPGQMRRWGRLTRNRPSGQSAEAGAHTVPGVAPAQGLRIGNPALSGR